MEGELARFTDAEFEAALTATLKKLIAPPCVKPYRHPQAVLLGGQSGAGKTALHMVYKKKLGQGAIVVNGDEYRSSHPRYYELNEAYGPEAVTHTAPWAGRMTEALIGALSAMRYNLIIEGTLRTAEVPVKTATLLRARGYGVSLALMAVKPEISLVSCQVRYELMRIAGTVPRATDPKHHDKIVRDIVGNLSALEQTGLFDEICLYARSRERLYPVEGETRTASEALQEVLFGPWTREEKEHYAHLEEKLASLKKHP
ncbi:zeta toxin family protein [Adlercreutzia sp. ZJ176]|nr:zeta toxin family protein [Adlercreutzia sp. ZJ176]